MKKPSPLLLSILFFLFGLFCVATPSHAEVNDVYTAKYAGHEISVEIEHLFLGTVYKAYLDNQTIGVGKIVGLGGEKKVTTMLEGQKVLITIKQGLSPDINLFINGAAIQMTHLRANQ